MIGTIIALSDHELRIARETGELRAEANKRAGTVDGNVTDYSPPDAHTIGVAGELAFCKLCNIYPDFEVSVRRGSADCQRLGESVDIKSTEYQTGRLLVRPTKRLVGTEVYALMTFKWQTGEPAPRWFRFRGFARADDLFTPERLRFFGRCDNYVMEQHELSLDQRSKFAPPER